MNFLRKVWHIVQFGDMALTLLFLALGHFVLGAMMVFYFNEDAHGFAKMFSIGGAVGWGLVHFAVGVAQVALVACKMPPAGMGIVGMWQLTVSGWEAHARISTVESTSAVVGPLIQALVAILMLYRSRLKPEE